MPRWRAQISRCQDGVVGGVFAPEALIGLATEVPLLTVQMTEAAPMPPDAG